jgi:hypothetical protein
MNLARHLFDTTPKTQPIRVKIDELDFVEIKTISSVKDISKK